MQDEITKNIYVKMGSYYVNLSVQIDRQKMLNVIEEIITNCSIKTKIRRELLIAYDFKNYFNNAHYRDILIEEPVTYQDVTKKEQKKKYSKYMEQQCRFISYTKYDYPAIVEKCYDIIRGHFGSEYGFGISFEVSTFQEEQVNFFQKEGKLLNEFSNITFPSHSVSEYYEEIMKCFIIENAIFVPERYVNEVFNSFEFLLKKRGNFEKNILYLESLEPILHNFIVESLQMIKTNTKEKELKINRLADQ